MRKTYKPLVVTLILIAIIYIARNFFSQYKLALFNTHGVIANKEKNLIIFAAALSLIVVIPVFVMTVYIATKYRESNKSAKYSPDWDHNTILETIWWLVPGALILVLSIVTWNSSHTLDPYKPIVSSAQPLRVQVVALQWKWLFIYPEQNIASVNYLNIPVNRPVNFEITADAPMNSFWIPQLSGQIYAMNGMSTQLHIMANETGNYTGRSANISGSGFAGMEFNTHVGSQQNFENWVNFVKQSNKTLNSYTYNQLATPQANYPVTLYSSTQPLLYDNIVARTMPNASPETAQL